ncbi:MAG: RpiB/LacA/LacB family sugar-phosphate isomerase [Lachnospiraceae bacterium]|nr:RpiB/LacA/LacB family sugar-phosphate isomerase [Lachnospiraceae bacterium]
MKIALVMEWSTCEKNEVVSRVLNKVAEENGHTVVNYGQYNMEDNRQTYNQNAVFTAALLNSGAADFVITGCGTGSGAMLACNAMPGVQCGLVGDSVETYLFTQINGGNCISIPYALRWGWAAELNLEYLLEKLFAKEPGGGYPESAAASEQRNAKLLTKLKAAANRDFLDIINNEDPDIRDMVKGAFAGKRMELFKENCSDQNMIAAIEAVIV